MSELIQTLGDNLVIAIIGLCAVVGMTLKAITTIVTNTVRERSRREIAAYIAEGSITPEQGERLIRADVNHGRPMGAA